MISVKIAGVDLSLNTDPRLFSPKHADQGTLFMLRHVTFSPEDEVLDLGCGYGLVGIYAAKCISPDRVVMTDLDPLAVRMSCENAHTNEVEGVTIVCGRAYEAIERSGFTKILTNPPYHSDFSVAKTFIEKGFNRLGPSGCMYMVTRRKPWYKNKLLSVFGGVQIWEEDGYYVFMAQKKTKRYADVQ